MLVTPGCEGERLQYKLGQERAARIVRSNL